MTDGRGWRGQVSNEEVPYNERSIQDIMIEDLQKQVVKLTQRLAAQNMEMYCDINGCDSKSNFENLYNNPVLVRK
jgi:formylmethanofuran:tetrahydromethanopterin formyltransferase